MSHPNDVKIHLEGMATPARFTSLEGERGLVRLRVENHALTVGEEYGVEMHDGSAFVFKTLEDLGDGEYRLKLARRGLV
ncbi:hypothetical protein [Deinococcus yavapaiensis]|uniref:Uncharacterized protein n=1 Tax=Deinococcus yavapaiensis KR-236 TaxID=694435 RepID=A0A318S3C8_9DEIO|nr:hypothetical protein [Deinococcus yavapaiensis]PYE51935.1 hypothetical protein DES52_114136 [Deinococcus yavapaiensis KR-236]